MSKLIPFKKSKFYEVLMMLSQKQLNDLSHFINFSANELTKRQKNALLEMIKLLSNRKVVYEENIIKKFYKQDKQYWPKAKTHILKVIYRYLKFFAFEQDVFIGDYYLLRYFDEKECYDNMLSFYKQIENKLNGLTYESSTFDKLQTTLLAEYLLLLNKTKRNTKSIETLENITGDLTNFYIKKQIRFLVELYNRNLRVTGKIYSKRNVEYNYLTKYKTADIEIIIWQHLLKLVSTKGRKTEDLYSQAYQQIMANSAKIDELKVYDFMLYLTNYCFDKIKEGYYGYVKLAWKNYLYLIDENLLVLNKKLSPFAYLNIILLGLKNRKLKLVDKYLNSLVEDMDDNNPDVKQAAYTLAKALKLYDAAKSKAKLHRCKNELIEFNTTDIKLKFQHDKLETKILFDLNYFDEILHLINDNIETYREYKEEDVRIYNFFNAIVKLIKGKSIKNLKPVNFHFSDYDWFLKKQ